MPFHHVTAGLLYKGNYLSRSLSDSDSDVLASISVEELDGKASRWTVWLLSCRMLNVLLKWFGCCCRPFYPIIIGTISPQMKMSRLYWNAEATGGCYCTVLWHVQSVAFQCKWYPELILEWKSVADVFPHSLPPFQFPSELSYQIKTFKNSLYLIEWLWY